MKEVENIRAEEQQKVDALDKSKKPFGLEIIDSARKARHNIIIKALDKSIEAYKKALSGMVEDEIEPGQSRIAPSEKQRRDRETSIQGLGRPLNQTIVTGDFSKNLSNATSVKGETYTSGRKAIDNDDLSWKRVGAFGW